jgi:hypothetical protein
VFNCIYSETEKRRMQSEVLDVDVFDCRLRRAAMGWAVITDWFVMTGLGTEMVDYNSGRVITNPPTPTRARARGQSTWLSTTLLPSLSLTFLSSHLTSPGEIHDKQPRRHTTRRLTKRTTPHLVNTTSTRLTPNPSTPDTMAFRSQPGPSYADEQIGRSSPLPPMPHVGVQNLGNPGSVPGQHTPGQTLHPSNSQPGSGSPGDKGPDYVYFERKPNQFGEAITGKAMAAKMKLELYYKEAVEGVVGRKERFVDCSYISAQRR